MIHKEAFPIVLYVLFALLLVVLAINLLFPVQTNIHYILYGIGLVFYFFVIRFFRVPVRKAIIDKNCIYSAADGDVVVIGEAYEDEYFKDQRLQVSVFMSPLNVHVNYSPISGEVIYHKHSPGKHIAAFKQKSSRENEHHSMVIKTEDGKEILVRQIAGVLARRILNYTGKGETLTQGLPYGFIRFGSRIDIFLPLDAKMEARLHEKAWATETVLARFN